MVILSHTKLNPNRYLVLGYFLDYAVENKYWEGNHKSVAEISSIKISKVQYEERWNKREIE